MNLKINCPCCGHEIEVSVRTSTGNAGGYGQVKFISSGRLGGGGGGGVGPAKFGHPNPFVECILPPNHPGPCKTNDGGVGYLGDGHSADQEPSPVKVATARQK